MVSYKKRLEKVFSPYGCHLGDWINIGLQQNRFSIYSERIFSFKS